MLTSALTALVLTVAPVPAPTVESGVESPAAPPPVAEPEVRDGAGGAFHRAQNRLSFASGGILLGWGLTNVAVGVAGNLTSEGRVRYFHQGNWAWNTVNVALGIAGLVGAARGREPVTSVRQGVEAGRKSQLVFAINAGLDVLYVSAGAAMWQLTLDDTTPVAQRVGGYGQALVLQGAFLFAFDVAMLWAHEILIDRYAAPAGLARLRPQLAPRPEGGLTLGLALRF